MSNTVSMRPRARPWWALLLAWAAAWVRAVQWAHAQPDEAADPPASASARSA